MNQPPDVVAGRQPRIVVFDQSPAKAAAFRSLGRLPGVSVWCAAFPFPFGEHPEVGEGFDAIVSPANAFGFMDGGIDWAYAQVFGPGLEARVRAEIAKRPFGELLVGEAVVVPTGHPRIPHLIAAPTMRVPRQITDAYDVVLATRAAVRAALTHTIVVLRHSATPPQQGGSRQVNGGLDGTQFGYAVETTTSAPLLTIALPGMGTGAGGLSASMAARAMEAGILAALGPPAPPASWREAYNRHVDLLP